MPLQPDLSLQYRLPQIDNPLVQAGQAYTLRNAMLQGDAAQRSMADDAAMKEAVRSGAGDLGATQKALLQGGFGKQALEFGKGIREQQDASTKLLEHDSKLVKAFGEQAKEELKTVGNQDQWTAFRNLQMQRSSSLTTPQFRELAAKSAQQMPEQFNPQWIQAMLAKTEGFATQDYTPINAGGTTVMQQMNPNAPGFSAAPIAHTQTQESIATNATTRRGQDMTDTRQRETNVIAAKTAGLRQQELQNKLEQQGVANAGTMASYQTAIETLDRLSKHRGLGEAVGVGWEKTLIPFWGPLIPGTERTNFVSELEAFKAQTFLPMVQSLRGMGALSDTEGKKLADAVGALNTDMKETDFKDSIVRIKKQLGEAKKRVMSGKLLAPAAPVADTPRVVDW